LDIRSLVTNFLSILDMNFWDFLRISENIWEYLRISENFWEFLSSEKPRCAEI
jgi:hypothetical protein